MSIKLSDKFVVDTWIAYAQDEIPYSPGERTVLKEESSDQRFQLLLAHGEREFYVHFMWS